MRPSLRSLLVTVCALLGALSVRAAESLPESLVGVWATEGAEFRGRLLMKGQALYLGRDGIGAIVGGPPPIGFKIVAKFDAQTNRIEFDGYEGDVRTTSGRLEYDPVRGVIFHADSPTKPLKRRSADFTSEDKRALGMSQ